MQRLGSTVRQHLMLRLRAATTPNGWQQRAAFTTPGVPGIEEYKASDADVAEINKELESFFGPASDTELTGVSSGALASNDPSNPEPPTPPPTPSPSPPSAHMSHHLPPLHHHSTPSIPLEAAAQQFCTALVQELHQLRQQVNHISQQLDIIIPQQPPHHAHTEPHTQQQEQPPRSAHLPPNMSITDSVQQLLQRHLEVLNSLSSSASQQQAPAPEASSSTAADIASEPAAEATVPSSDAASTPLPPASGSTAMGAARSMATLSSSAWASSSTADISERLTHVDDSGRAAMVDVGTKLPTVREARASAKVLLGAQAYQLVSANQLAKGDVLTVAQLAGIMGAKHTSLLIPLCHSLHLSKVDVQLQLLPDQHAIKIASLARTVGQTGVEMEALTAASVAALTVYDMCKAVSKGIVIADVRLEYKSGGKSGVYDRGDGE